MIKSCFKIIKKFKVSLYKKFEMSNIFESEVTFYLKIKCMQVRKGIFMTQKAYAQNILTTFSMKNYIYTTTPIDKILKLKANMEEDEVDPTLYRSIVEKCLHLTHIRLNI